MIGGMCLIGLTGGIGMGKSAVAEHLVRCGELLVDTDILARKLVEPGESALREIREVFGAEVFDSAGLLNRTALAAIVFSSNDLRRKLETILHPRIRYVWKKQVEQWKAGGARRGVVVIPLLYETDAESELDEVICVACSKNTQRQRLLARGWSAQEIERRIAAQWPISRKMDRADGVIWTESAVEASEEQCDRLIARSN